MKTIKIFAFVLIVPIFVSAQTLGVDCVAGAPNCDFNDLLNLARNIIDFIIIVSIPAAAVAFAWAGFIMLTAQGSSSKISEAKGIFWKVLIGFLFVLSGWLIVRTITSVLLEDGSYWNPFVFESSGQFDKTAKADKIIL